ncbi:MAG: PEP-CTERM sorting domain-containing protein [Candidatus Pacebacteria bacterium]|nr:PEP-CTERM sorting domain-containing protein [Candidatus Paceibacterota bacterium]
MKKILCAALAAFVVYASPSSLMAQGSIVNFFAIGPETGESTYTGFLVNMVSSMRGISSLSTPFIPMESVVNAREIVSYDDRTGRKLFSGFSHISPTPFLLSDMSACLSSSFFSSSNMLSGVKFGNAVVGIRWGPNGPGTADTVYTSGAADLTLVNEVYVVANTYTIRATDVSDLERAVASFGRLHGDVVDIDSKYTSGSLSGYGSISLAVPEPTSFALMGIAALALTFRRKR